MSGERSPNPVSSIEALRTSEKHFRLMVEGVTAYAIFMLDRDGHVASWNPGAERIKGYSADEVVGYHFSCFYPPEDVAAGKPAEALQRAILEGYFEEEAWRVRKDGERIWASVTIAPIYEMGGELVGFVKVTRDITDRKRDADEHASAQERARVKLESQLRQAQKMEAFGQLAGGVAHDFNNLLTVINGYSEVLLESLLAADSRRTMVEQIHQAGERAASLTRQLLAFSRQQVLEPRVLELNAIVANIEKLLRRVIGEDVELVTVLRSGLDTVRVDPGQIEQVIVNLAVNARDAMPQGGKLTIETSAVELDEGYTESHPEVVPGHYLMLAITDNGEGMAPEVRSQVFEPFFTTKDVGKGTGLGLAVVHGIVKQSGGSVEVYSEIGSGTTFKVYLPAVRADAAEASGLASAPSPRGSEVILLVEDEEAVRTLAATALQGLGYRVLAAPHARAALEMVDAEARNIDLLVTDVVMPEMNGRELSEVLLSRNRTLKVLFMSGYADDAVVRHGVLSADVAFLQKPFTPGSLGRKVREVLDRA